MKAEAELRKLFEDFNSEHNYMHIRALEVMKGRPNGESFPRLSTGNSPQCTSGLALRSFSSSLPVIVL